MEEDEASVKCYTVLGKKKKKKKWISASDMAHFNIWHLTIDREDFPLPKTVALARGMLFCSPTQV